MTRCTTGLSYLQSLTLRVKAKQASLEQRNRTAVSAAGLDIVHKLTPGLHDLYGRAKALFDLVAPQEYGFDAEAKEEIGILTSLPLLRKVWEDLDEARRTGKSLACFYFTKESHITTFVHLLLASGLPFTNVRIPELDYCSHCTIELWEKTTTTGAKEFSLRLSISEGAHSPAVLDSNVDAVSTTIWNAKTLVLLLIPAPQSHCAAT